MATIEPAALVAFNVPLPSSTIVSANVDTVHYFVDPYGRVLAQSDIFQPAVIVGRARFLTGLTFYARHGDIFAYASVVVTVVALVASRRQKGRG